MEPIVSRVLQRPGVFLPAFVSLWSLVQLWLAGELFGTSGTLFCAWFFIALFTQVFASTTLFWALGLVAQTLLAITPVLKRQLTQI
jgi:hypothetical protein